MSPAPLALPDETRLYARWENIRPETLASARPPPRPRPAIATLAMRLFGRGGR